MGKPIHHNLGPELDKVIIFDGVCNLCENSVRFIVRHDRAACFRFVSAQSERGQTLQQQLGIDVLAEETMVLIRGERALFRSDAALEIIRHLDGAWKLLYVFKLLPRCIRDPGYRKVARNRYRWYGKKAQCMLPSPRLMQRFLM